jgi:signal transduction histidine kinase
MSAEAVLTIALAVDALCLTLLAVSVHRALDWRARVRSLSRPLHELRGAVTALELGLGVLLRSCTCADVGNRADALYAQIERGTAALEEIDRRRTRRLETTVDRHRDLIDLEALVLSRVRCWEQIAPGYRSRVRTEWRAGPAWTVGDSAALASALDNLVTNALEHGGGRILVEGERSGNVLRVLICDGGRGVFDLSGIGEPDWASARGHGLAIAREAVEAHGGRLVTRARLSGTAIAIELPVQGTAAPEHPQRHGASPPPITRGVASAA